MSKINETTVNALSALLLDAKDDEELATVQGQIAAKLSTGEIDIPTFTAVQSAYTAAKVAAASKSGGDGGEIRIYKGPSGTVCLTLNGAQRPTSLYAEQVLHLAANLPTVLQYVADGAGGNLSLKRMEAKDAKARAAELLKAIKIDAKPDWARAAVVREKTPEELAKAAERAAAAK